MKKTLLIAALLCLFNLYGQENKDYNQELMNMFEMSGTQETYQAMISQMFTMFQKQYPNVPAETWEELEMEFKYKSMQELVTLLAPVYEKHLTIDDLRDIVKFYKTPAGIKLRNSAPSITTESMQIGQQWGMKIGEEFVKKMSSKGYERT